MASRRTQISPLTAEALRLIARGKVERYRGLFEQAAAIEDRNARYLARRELLRAVLENGGSAPPEALDKLLAAAARESIAALEHDPREPGLLNDVGVALSLLRSFEAAQALFEAALRLDPDLSNVVRNLAKVAEMRQLPAGTVVPAAIGELAQRALTVAERAQPAVGKTVSLCMIVKDEEEMLPRCLAAAAPAVDEIVIVDTGSRDRTIEIAKSFGARVLEREWTGSFADARNVALDAATSDWLFVLDADEMLVPDDVERLRALLGQTWREAFYLTETNYTGELEDGTATNHSTMRIFQARPEYRFHGRLHEQITHTFPTHIPERFAITPVRLDHFGYLGAVRDAKEKSRRNIALLERQRDEGDDSAFMHFNLGSEHGAMGDAAAALVEYDRAAELLEIEPGVPQAAFVPAFVRRHLRVMRLCGREQEALERAEKALAVFPGFTDLVYEQAVTARALERRDEAIAYFERCIEMGDAPAHYTSTVGMGTFLPKIGLAELLLEQGESARAVELLDGALAKYNGFFGLILPYATAQLSAGASPEEVVERTERHVERLTPTMRFMLGTALYERGQTVAAEGQYRLLLEQQPTSGMGRVALAEALLSQSRWEEAAEVAAALPDGEAHAAAARRSELFGRIAAGDLDGAAAAIARDRALAELGEDEASRALPPGDRELFAAWLAAVRGEQDDDSVLPLESVGLLEVTLEALLRVEEVELFATLVPLVGRCPIAPREQHELRAGLYLRRGFLASAAEEWIAVASTEPDVRALLGLAHVAVGQGMAEEALDFAREAYALDPENQDASRVLARLEPLAA
ncbi:glycosyltransferase [Conexibacter stalactiti]|uniref:Glycosyltransferase n=1 Tax=Conexibacter stalactiti TaxID=1940611 RepID=A0ABU4HX00_9ACTN|nr:glycosyltransferase [Conexibacter stalactiti]MDW5597020.1 glycosyltransferase [Conexibacter stalactiti]MEC5037662.1 glycosyltransferase [Conexibacter stalactiti]